MIQFSAPIIDLILAGVIAEFVALAIWLRRRGQSSLVVPLFLFLASGGALMVALRFSLAPGQNGLIALPMLAALFLHASFLAVGYRRFGRGQGQDRR